mmetsp:Transcript_102421/g.285423  ORF Transcript_102421/g.285423 Transcript_102421/m.285423 type:complete len:252 (+) Transcript_102421:543-1298(+)
MPVQGGEVEYGVACGVHLVHEGHSVHQGTGIVDATFSDGGNASHVAHILAVSLHAHGERVLYLDLGRQLFPSGCLGCVEEGGSLRQAPMLRSLKRRSALVVARLQIGLLDKCPAGLELLAVSQHCMVQRCAPTNVTCQNLVLVIVPSPQDGFATGSQAVGRRMVQSGHSLVISLDKQLRGALFHHSKGLPLVVGHHYLLQLCPLLSVPSLCSLGFGNECCSFCCLGLLFGLPLGCFLLRACHCFLHRQRHG